ncbi:MAG: hypothetical protein N3I35_16585 [Clostridia bacterium]|nr:hypothetical protein [Clostridia bacterium]
MNINYYLEFFLESLTDFFSNRYNKESISLPASILNNRINLRSFYTGDVHYLCTKEILDVLDIPYICTETDENQDISLNFLQHHQIRDFRSTDISDNLQHQSIFSAKKWISGFPNAILKSQDEIEYMVGIQNENLPFIVAYNAYNVDIAIWERLYGNLYEQFNFVIFSGNYGSFSETPGKINAILESECIGKQAIALTWCSGFKVFAQFNQQYPGWFTKLYAVTGNYIKINGAGQLSEFENSTLALTSLMDGDSKTNVGKVFMYFLSKQAKNPFGIPADVWNMISAKLSEIDYFSRYINSIKELLEYDLIDSLSSINFPMTNIIASNDIISMLSNNELIDKEVGNCKHIMLNFATHWCLWTHTGQIAEIINLKESF